MLSLYEILKASKTGIAPDMWTALAGKNWNGTDTGHEVKELTGIPPLSFRADGTPLIDYIISGNMVQTGTPTPDEPITPSECGERTGNLFDGVIEVGGLDTTTGAETEQTNRRRSDYIEIEENTNYNLSRTITATTSNLWALFYDENKGYISGSNKGTSDANFTVLSPANAKYLRWYVTVNGSYDNLMIIEGSTAPSTYIPYGYKIPITSGNTTTPVYLGEVQSTRRIKKYVCTGDESWSVTSGQGKTRAVANFTTNMGIEPLSKVLSTHYIGVEGGAAYPNINTISVNTNGTMIIGISSEFTDSEAWKSYLAQQYANGTPVTVWYVLATETTGIVNEPLRKIGDYADTVSYEQAQVSIPTTNGTTVIDVDTTLKPSEVYIKYNG